MAAHLAAVASRYLGETEKALHEIFESAERADVELLFDEAEALFGERSEVKDSHDRYADLEASSIVIRLEKLVAAHKPARARRRR